MYHLLSPNWSPRYVLLLAALASVALQPRRSSAQIAEAAETITPADIAGHVGVIAHDSMLGRDTPSRGLTMTAQYIADQFAALGLKPGGDGDTWLKQYRIPSRFNFVKSQVTFTAGATKVTTNFLTGARLVTTNVPQEPVRGSAILVAGGHTTESIQRASNRDKIILYIVTADVSLPTMLDLLLRGNKGVIVLSSEDSATFAARLQAMRRRPIVQLGSDWIVRVQPEAVAGLEATLAVDSVDLDQVRSDTVPIIRELPSLEVAFDPHVDRPATGEEIGLNAVGVIEGSDPKLKHEYVYISAHMDHTGITHGADDSIVNGADDNASGAAGLIALAKAFNQPGARPRRSMIFLATSGGARDLWGSYDVNQRLSSTSDGFFQIPSRLGTPVANINLDMIGRAAGDSVAVTGLREVELATPLDWIAAAHSELGLTITDGGTASSPWSDHFWFFQNSVPSLTFHNATAEEHRAPKGSPDTVDAAREARILRLVFYIGQEITNSEKQPRLTLEGRRRFLDARRR